MLTDFFRFTHSHVKRMGDEKLAKIPNAQKVENVVRK